MTESSKEKYSYEELERLFLLYQENNNKQWAQICRLMNVIEKLSNEKKA